MEDGVAFGRWLKQRRKALDFTQERLAEQVGCAVETIRKIEAGTRRPSRAIAAQLAEHLAIAPEHRAEFMRHARFVADTAGGRLQPPAVVAVSRATVPPLHVPTSLTPLLGRADDLAALHRLIFRTDVRLLTLVGAPGVGKTRLALQLAASLGASFPDGVWWVALTPVHNPQFVLSTLAQTLGVQPVDGQSVLTTLQQQLQHKHLLLVLDNMEHVVSAASSIAALLATAPQLKVVVTSRVPLHLSGEQQYLVPPLAVPNGQALVLSAVGEYAAVQLFVERAQAVKADFVLTDDNVAAVVEMCKRLDGVPLAIELAAARCKLFTSQRLVPLLSRALTVFTDGATDRPLQQCTLHSAIAWSYHLLAPAEQRLFRRLGVFVGGWTIDAAHAICTDAALRLDMVEGVASLLDNSLIQHAKLVDTDACGEPRFEMLETVRMYAAEQLAHSDDAATIERRHVEHFLAVAEAAEPHFTRSDQTVWLACVERDLANIRAALAWCMRDGERAETGLRMVTALWWFWHLHGHRQEAQRWLEQGVAASTGRDSGVRAKALCLLGNEMRSQHDYVRATQLLDESLALYEALGLQHERADVLENLGYVAQWQAQYAEAAQRFHASLAVYRTLDSQSDVAWLLNTLGELARCQNDYAAARRWYEQSLPLHQASGSARGAAIVVHNLGYVALAEHDIAQAAAAFARSLTLFQQLSDTEGIAWCFAGLAGVIVRGRLEQDAQRAARLLGTAHAVRMTITAQMWPADRVEHERTIATLRTHLGSAAFDAAWTKGRAMSLDEAMADALGAIPEQAAGV